MYWRRQAGRVPGKDGRFVEMPLPAMKGFTVRRSAAGADGGVAIRLLRAIELDVQAAPIRSGLVRFCGRCSHARAE
jgi:hypothetical protein